RHDSTPSFCYLRLMSAAGQRTWIGVCAGTAATAATQCKELRSRPYNGIVNNLAADERQQHLSTWNVWGRHMEDVLRQHDEIGYFPGLDRSLPGFLELCLGRGTGIRNHRLLNRQRLRRMRRLNHREEQIQKRISRHHDRVGAKGDLDVRLEKAAHRVDLG